MCLQSDVTQKKKKENQFHVTRSHTTLKTNVNIERFPYTEEKQLFIEAKSRYVVAL